MKVMLFNPWLPIHPSITPSFGNAWPLGLLYVAAAVRAAGHKVDIFDASVGGSVTYKPDGKFFLLNLMTAIQGYQNSLPLVGAPIDSLKAALERSRPEVVGLSLPISSQHDFVPFFVKLIKENSNAKIVVGGTHATMAAELLTGMDGIDYIVTGEGEVSFPKLLTAIENKQPTDEIAGVYPKPFELIENIDDLAFPAFDLVPEFSYFAATNTATVQIISSRGCPFNCRFCSTPYLTHRKWRAHTALRVLAEMEQLVINGAKEIRFVDDNATLDKDRWKTIMEGVIRSGWGIKLSAHSLYFKTLDKEALTLMRLAGFERIKISPESGNDRVLRELMGKPFTVAECEQAVHDITEAGMAPGIDIILGMPGETLAEIQDTVDFCHRIKEYNPESYAWISCALPMLRTELYDEVVEKGLFTGGVPELFSFATATYDGMDWTREDLKKIWSTLYYNMNNKGKAP